MAPNQKLFLKEIHSFDLIFPHALPENSIFALLKELHSLFCQCISKTRLVKIYMNSIQLTFVAND